MVVPKNTVTPAVLQLQMEIVYNVNTEFPFNSTENIIIRLCMIYTNGIVMHKAEMIFIHEN